MHNTQIKTWFGRSHLGRPWSDCRPLLSCEGWSQTAQERDAGQPTLPLALLLESLASRGSPSKNFRLGGNLGAIAPQRAPLTTTLCLHTPTSGELCPSKGSQLHDVADLTSKKHAVSLESASTLSLTLLPHPSAPRGTVALCPSFFRTQRFLHHTPGHHTAGPRVPHECGGQPRAVQTREVWAVTGTGSSTRQEDPDTEQMWPCWRLPRL